MPLTRVVFVSVPLSPGRWWVSLKGRSTSSAAALRRTSALMDVGDCSSGPSPSKPESSHRWVSQFVWGEASACLSLFLLFWNALWVYVASDWWLLQANGSARVRLGATEIIASVKVRDRPCLHLLQIGQDEYFCMSSSILCMPSSILDLALNFQTSNSDVPKTMRLSVIECY
jgi:hypothetical protein